MIINVLAVLFCLLAIYWFAFKEGFFSGVVHLACVLAAAPKCPATEGSS